MTPADRALLDLFALYLRARFPRRDGMMEDVVLGEDGNPTRDQVNDALDAYMASRVAEREESQA